MFAPENSPALADALNPFAYRSSMGPDMDGLIGPPTATTLGSEKCLRSFSSQKFGWVVSASVETMIGVSAASTPACLRAVILTLGIMITRSASSLAISTVSSVLPLSTTIISAGGTVWYRRDLRQSPMNSSSLRAGIITEDSKSITKTNIPRYININYGNVRGVDYCSPRRSRGLPR